MKYYYNLYLDDYVASNKKEIIEKLENNEWQLEVYLIVLSAHIGNQLEIYNSTLLLQKSFRKEELLIVGITKGYNESLEVVEKIMQEVYDNTKGTDMKSYILNNQQIFEEGNR